jgi:hypothetical protein
VLLLAILAYLLADQLSLLQWALLLPLLLLRRMLLSKMLATGLGSAGRMEVQNHKQSSACTDSQFGNMQCTWHQHCNSWLLLLHA